MVDNTIAVNTEKLNCEVPVTDDCRSGIDNDPAGANAGSSGSDISISSLLPDRLAHLNLRPTVTKNTESVDSTCLSSLSSSGSPVGVSHSDGSIHSSISQVPSHLSKSLNYSMSLPFLRHMDVTRVCDGLYLSDYMSLSASKLRELNVTFVINATKELPNVEGADSSVEFLKLFMDDIRTQDIAQHFNLCADKIHDLRTKGGVSLIHCALGISRSVTICLAYLVKYGGCTLRQAYLELKKKREIIRPNDGFWRQLIAFETSVLGRPSVKLLVYPMGVIPDVYKSAPERRPAQRYNF